jgi:hypothetical protein
MGRIGIGGKFKARTAALVSGAVSSETGVSERWGLWSEPAISLRKRIAFSLGTIPWTSASYRHHATESINRELESLALCFPLPQYVGIGYLCPSTIGCLLNQINRYRVFLI